MAEQKKYTLQIALMGDNEQITSYYYNQFIKDNRDQILIPGRNKLIMNDGTIVVKHSLGSGVSGIRGCRYDQIIWCFQGMITKEILQAVKDTLRGSQVPEHHRFLCPDCEDDYE